MPQPVNTEEFTTGAIRRKPEFFEFVKFRMADGVARLTLSRPEHNLLNEAMLREIADGIVFAGERELHPDVAADGARAEAQAADTALARGELKSGSRWRGNKSS